MMYLSVGWLTNAGMSVDPNDMPSALIVARDMVICILVEVGTRGRGAGACLIQSRWASSAGLTSTHVPHCVAPLQEVLFFYSHLMLVRAG